LVGVLHSQDPETSFLVVEFRPITAPSNGMISAAGLASVSGAAASWSGALGLVVREPGAKLKDLADIVAACKDHLRDRALILHVATDGMVSTHVFRRDSESLEALPLVFPGDPALLAASDYVPFRKMLLDGMSHELPEPPAETLHLPPAPPVRRRSNATWFWRAAVIAIIILMGAGFWNLASRFIQVAAPVATAPQPALHLEVTRAPDGGLDIRWDRSAARVLGSTSGTLAIQDSDQRLELPLDHLGLNTGQILYVPQGGNVELLLTMHTNSGAVQELVRVLRSPGSGALTVAALKPPAPKPQQVARNRTESPAPIQEPTEQNATLEEAPPASSVLESLRQASPFNQIQMTSAQLPASSTLQPPPVVTPKPTPPPPSRQPVTLPQTPAAKESVAPPVSQPPARPEPAVRSPLTMPPKPQRQVVPVVPSHLKPLLTRALVVEVKLSVDASGRVTKAEAADGAGIMGHLGRVSESAARQWTFQPGTINGQPVPSVHVVQFRFGK
jgi:hypothetical protein